MDPAVIDLALRSLALKRRVRTGWRRVEGVSGPESVAEHSWGVALLALLLSLERPGLDRGHLLTVALAHDLAEAVTGDLAPGQYRSKEEKRALEEAGLDRLLAGAPAPVAQALREAWLDYEDRASPEARFVADLDKLEMALQARAYAAEGGDLAALEEFWESAVHRIGDPALLAAARRLRP